jgi:hypothetical protein
LLTASAVHAAPPEPATVADARRRFEAGVERFNAGDYAGALVEFQRSYVLRPHHGVLYNIGQCLLRMGRHAEAMETLTRFLRDGGEHVSPRQRQEAQRQIRESWNRVAHVDVRTSVPGAGVRVDGRDVGVSPLPRAVLVTPGPHVFEAVREGYEAARLERLIEPGAVALLIELRPLPAPAAPQATAPAPAPESTVSLNVDVPGATVLVDERDIGRSPLAQAVAIPPGRHAFEVRKEGYRNERVVQVLPPGSTTLLFEMHPLADLAAPAGATDVAWTPSTTAGLEPPAGQGRSRTVIWMGYGAAGALLVGAAITGAMALDKQHEFEDLERDDPRADDLADKGRRLAVITDVLWITGAATGLGVTVWWFGDDGGGVATLGTHGRF